MIMTVSVSVVKAECTNPKLVFGVTDSTGSLSVFFT